MSALAVTDAVVAAVESGEYDLIAANFANPDMVGHTGVWDATVAACELLDGCIGRIADAVAAADASSIAAGGPGALLAVTADHGNADVMRDATGAVVTAHSLSLVPLLLAGTPANGATAQGWRPGRRDPDAARLPRPADRAGHDRAFARGAGQGSAGLVISCRPSNRA